MKKICLIIILSLIMCLLVSCNNYPIEINSRTILYNGHKYILQDNDSDFSKYFYNTYEPNEESISQRIAITPLLKVMWIIWIHEFDDNILRVGSPGVVNEYYFKEGFEFPKYDEVALSHLLIEDEIIELPQEKNVSWRNIIDYNTTIPYDESHERYWSYGELRDYNISLQTGRFYVTLIEEVVYIALDIIKEDSVYYKISDEYQQIIKDAIAAYNEQ